jgi:hypothetical protein
VHSAQHQDDQAVIVQAPRHPRERGADQGGEEGQFIHYSLVADNLANILTGFIQEVCPVARPLKKESRAKAAKGKT